MTTIKNPYEAFSAAHYLNGNPYPGRGIIAGLTENGKAAIAYFIMGRSENSRNRVFLKEGDDVRTKAFDESKVEDPSLIIYYPVRTVGKTLIVTNGDQTDTVADLCTGSADLDSGVFAKALRTRQFEPDGPNWTPRISAILDLSGDTPFRYDMSILKSSDPEGTGNVRNFYEYDGIPGEGRFIHTYQTDGSPIPTFMGEPDRVEIPDDLDAFTDEIWKNLDEANKISLYVRYTDLKTGAYEDRLINKHC